MKLLFQFCLTALFFFQTVHADYSFPKSIAFSAVAPGTGQLYLNKPTKAGVFFSADLILIFSYFRFKDEKNWAIHSYKQYAESIIGLDRTSQESDYRLVQNFFSSEDYNANVRRYARDRFLIFGNDTTAYYEYLEANIIPDSEGWHWQTRENWKKYRQIRTEKQDYEIYSNFAVGALVLNRVVSVIDAALTTKKLNRTLRNVSIEPNFSKNGFEVTYEISF
jgi:hypothetical protein